MKTSGRVFKYDDNVDTDVIIPMRYLNTSDPKGLAVHCMGDIDSDFTKKVEEGDIIVANKNFGCGLSREHALIVVKESGVSCVIVSTFTRIFCGNTINVGLPIMECKEVVKSIDIGGELEIDSTTGIINNKPKKQEYRGEPLPEFIQKIISSNGLANYIKSEKVKSEGGKN